LRGGAGGEIEGDEKGETMSKFFVGADFGQVQDYSTIAVVERAELRGAWDPAWYAFRKKVELRVRMLERQPLGTPYPEVVERIVEVTQSPALGGNLHLIVDATGVGRPLVDLLKAARPAGLMKAVSVTTGERQTESGGVYSVPKRDLIVGLQVQLQAGTVRMAETLPNVRALVEEMMGMEVRVSPSGREQFAAWRRGRHDDLVFAVALACWGAAQNRYQPETHWVNRREAEAAEEFRGVVGRLREMR
jgi:hypothetical protein